MKALDDSQIAAFDGVERVVAQPLHFKRKLGIGEDAYGSLKLKKHAQELWDVAGAAAAGAGVAASSTVATTFFGYTATGGILSVIGLGTAAATPVGWVIGAAVVSGGAYYGVMRLFSGYQGKRVDVIPKYINTPLDVLGVALFDLMGTLAIGVAHVDGRIDPRERAQIKTHFVDEWGLDSAYVDRALDVLVANAGATRIKDAARAIAQFVVANPDCNPQAIRETLIGLLGDIIAADGVQDEREEHAMDVVAMVLAEELDLSAKSVRDNVAALPSKAKTMLERLSRVARGKKDVATPA